VIPVPAFFNPKLNHVQTAKSDSYLLDIRTEPDEQLSIFYNFLWPQAWSLNPLSEVFILFMGRAAGFEPALHRNDVQEETMRLKRIAAASEKPDSNSYTSTTVTTVNLLGFQSASQFLVSLPVPVQEVCNITRYNLAATGTFFI
jgi:hypothetical protein